MTLTISRQRVAGDAGRQRNGHRTTEGQRAGTVARVEQPGRCRGDEPSSGRRRGRHEHRRHVDDHRHRRWREDVDRTVDADRDDGRVGDGAAGSDVDGRSAGSGGAGRPRGDVRRRRSIRSGDGDGRGGDAAGDARPAGDLHPDRVGVEAGAPAFGWRECRPLEAGRQRSAATGWRSDRARPTPSPPATETAHDAPIKAMTMLRRDSPKGRTGTARTTARRSARRPSRRHATTSSGCGRRRCSPARRRPRRSPSSRWIFSGKLFTSSSEYDRYWFSSWRSHPTM